MKKKLKHDQVDIIRNILEVFDENGLGNHVLASYLFGSMVQQRHRQQSDIDLAFLLDDFIYQKDPLAAVSKIYITAAKISKKMRQKTDVTILNSSSLEMAYEIITTGRCIYDSDTDRRLEYEAALRGMYFDFRPFLEEIRFKAIPFSGKDHEID